MKTISKTALLICTLIFGIQTINAQLSANSNTKNLLEDGGVTNNGIWRQRCGKNPETGATPDSCCSIDPTIGKTDKGSILLVGNGSREWRSMQNAKVIQVEQGKKYHISAWVKTENISKKSRVYFEFVVKTKNENGKPGDYLPKEFQPKLNDLPVDNVKGTHDWLLIECTYTIPENGEYLVSIHARYDPVIDDSKSSKVWFDDLMITKIQ